MIQNSVMMCLGVSKAEGVGRKKRSETNGTRGLGYMLGRNHLFTFSTFL